MGRLKKAIILGLLVGLFGNLLYFLVFGAVLEEALGLSVLFKLRGAKTPAEDTVIVAIDKRSADRLGLPNDLRAWPRSLHAKVVDQLRLAGAKAIAFDIYFKAAKPDQEDKQLAASLRRAGNVTLFAYVKREVLRVSTDDAERYNHINIESLEQPTDKLADAAVALAPFTLPKIPIKVSQFWTYRPSVGDTPTLPVVMLQLYAMDSYPDMLRLMQQVDPAFAQQLPINSQQALEDYGLVNLISTLRTRLAQEPGMYRALLRALVQDLQLEKNHTRRAKILALLKMYQGKELQYLNFYGPPRSITTLIYADILDATPTALTALKDKAVFIGYAAQRQPEQKDWFYTVFSQADGLDLSGVEIAATAFTNLLERKTLSQLSVAALIALFLLFGLITGILARLLHFTGAMLSTSIIALLYGATSLGLFTTQALWIPLIIPLCLQLPVALFAGLAWQYHDNNRERQRVRKVFGYFLPQGVVDQLIKSPDKLLHGNRLLFGICLSTDAEQYTRLAETMDPNQLGDLMNHYYKILFEPVRNCGGMISDVIGDAMLATWSANKPDKILRAKACEAALSIAKAVQTFSHRSSQLILPTRIGLHSGLLMMGHVGAIDHYEYRAVGDIVNTASRIQGLNKQLGTTIIASNDVLADLDGLVSRNLGCFRMLGKDRPVHVHELICHETERKPRIDKLCSQFAKGLAAYQDQKWDLAYGIFSQILSEYPTDGPSEFYLELCQAFQMDRPQDNWDGVVCMNQK